MSLKPQVTQDEIDRVAAYWAWVREMACEHPEVTFSSRESPSCSSCGRPVRWMSDIQIEERGRR